MINLDIPVQSPHPHLNWTVTHKRRLDMGNEEHKADLAFSKRLRAVQEYHRLQRNQQFKDETEHLHRYTVLENSRAFNQYKYQYYLGTQLDIYI